ncbi:MAG: hypothetical protein ABH863_01795 [Candidatus Micrarchaeota archaeon]
MYGGTPVAGKSSHLESSIPLILIIILAIFVAGNFGIINLGDIPGIGPILGGGNQVRVAVIGTPSVGLKNYLISKDAQLAKIKYAGNLRAESLSATGSLKLFDVVILQGQPVCDRTPRRIISEWVRGGGKLIVVGDACTRVNDDNSVLGWDIGVGLLGDVMPVKVGGLTSQAEPIKYGCSSGTFTWAQFDHSIRSGAKDYPFSGRTIETIPYNGNIVAYIDCGSSGRGSTATTPAIVESSSLLGGKTVYFSYDPGINGDAAGRTVFINTLKYLKSQKG